MTRLSGDLRGAVCLVSGATRGVGRAIVLRLCRAGATVVGLYRTSEEHARALAAEAADRGWQLDLLQCDVGQRDQVAATVDSVRARYGRIDCLVNNAGIWRGGPLVDLHPNDWSAVITTNLFGTFHLTQLVLPGMLSAKRGRIVNVASVVGITGYPGDCAYAAAKAGIIAFTKSLAKEVAKDGIVVATVAPGSLNTDMTMALSERARERLLARVPAGRRGAAGEVAAAVHFLLVGPVYLTGTVLTIDGAMT